jgi:Mrp family chromosome partitioning ATPase
MPTSLAETLRPEIITAYHEKPFQAPVIGVTGGKGGVGKTTVAVNVACALADMGHKVALVDADVDAPNAAILLGVALKNSGDALLLCRLLMKVNVTHAVPALKPAALTPCFFLRTKLLCC